MKNNELELSGTSLSFKAQNLKIPIKNAKAASCRTLSRELLFHQNLFEKEGVVMKLNETEYET